MRPTGSRARSSAPAEKPVVVVASIKGALRITALNDAAARLGLKPGMALADARAMYPSLAVVEADPEADRSLLDAIADWCDRYTPLVGLDPPDGLAARHHRLRASVRRRGGAGRDLVSAARTRRALRAASRSPIRSAAPGRVARYGEASGIVPRGRDRKRRRCRCRSRRCASTPRSSRDLAQVGLKRIADLLDRPRAPFAARFGEEFLRRLDQALGREDEPITPRLPVPAAMAEQRFPEPIAREADVLGTIEHLARRARPVLERRGEGGRLFQVALFRTDGKVHRLELGTGAPLRDPARIRKLFAERLAVLGDACDPGFGYDMVRLSALVTERIDPAQTGLAGADHATNWRI